MDGIISSDAMTALADRTAAAAVRVLEACRAWVGRDVDDEVRLIDLEIAAWHVGRAGGTPPKLPDDTEDLHVRMACAFGAGRDEAALALVDERAAADDGYRLLLDACHLVGDRLADPLIELAERHCDVSVSGTMLARTRQPERLLALMQGDSREFSTIAELVIRGRDAGTPCAPAEQAWAEVSHPAREPTYDRGYREATLRLLARESLDCAVAELEELDARGRGRTD